MPRRRSHLLLLLPLVATLAALVNWRARAGENTPAAEQARATTTRRRLPCPDAEALAIRYAPALALAPDDEAPRTIEMLLDRAKLVYKERDLQAEVANPSAGRLAEFADHPEAALELPPPVDDRAAQRRLYEEAVASDRSDRYPVNAYAGVLCDANTEDMDGLTVIQYWFFYLYNDGYNKHEGDWEMIQIVLDPELTPRYAAYAQHNSYTWRDWSDMLVETRPGRGGGEPPAQHPRVYVASGSHASYFQYTLGGYGGDSVVDAAQFVVPRITVLPVSDDAETGRFGWLRFPGAWGSDIPTGRTCKVCERGPAGPMFNSGGGKWRAPLVWGRPRPGRDDLVVHRVARISIQTGARVHVYDAQNRHDGPLPGGRLERAIPGLARVNGGDGQQVVLIPGLDIGTQARIDVEGGDISGIDLELPESNGGTRLRFGSVPVGVAGRARLLFGSGSVVMQIDADGDGRFERTLNPQSSERLSTSDTR